VVTGRVDVGGTCSHIGEYDNEGIRALIAEDDEFREDVDGVELEIADAAD
jgi:hypothetical protein